MVEDIGTLTMIMLVEGIATGSIVSSLVIEATVEDKVMIILVGKGVGT